MERIWKTAIGQDSHRFEDASSSKVLKLGGIAVPGLPGLQGNSDADVILHAVTNAVSGVTGINVLGFKADELAGDGVKDSGVYLKEALKSLPPFRIEHVSLSAECLKPSLKPYLEAIRGNLAGLLGIVPGQVGLTATSGEGLTDFGKGLGIQCFAVLTVSAREG